MVTVLGVSLLFLFLAQYEGMLMCLFAFLLGLSVFFVEFLRYICFSCGFGGFLLNLS